MATTFCELSDTGLIALSGADAVTFLQGQLTSDVAGLEPPRTQYSGYCTPKGRLLATFLVWRLDAEILLQLPRALRESMQSRMSKYVLRSKVSVSDATERYMLFGLVGDDAARAISSVVEAAPGAVHAVSVRDGIAVTALPTDRYLMLVPASSADDVRNKLSSVAEARPAASWSALDIDAGVAVVTPETQEQYVPQMLNLDLIGAVSYSKGCYPGQEIVARTHYLGRVKQRTYRVRAPEGAELRIGDRLFSDEYGREQASGTIVNAAANGATALAVVYTSSVARGVHHRALDGPPIAIETLPYALDA
jgi:folate-binding protein YgfZ